MQFFSLVVGTTSIDTRGTHTHADFWIFLKKNPKIVRGDLSA